MLTVSKALRVMLDKNVIGWYSMVPSSEAYQVCP